MSSTSSVAGSVAVMDFESNAQPKSATEPQKSPTRRGSSDTALT